MCTRYYMEMDPELRPIVEKAKGVSLTHKMIDKLGKPLKTEGEIRPTDMVPVIAPDSSGRRSVFPMVWGYTMPGLDRPVVNCRLETAPIKDVWKESWKSHRCVIPASWYYEWEHMTGADGKVKTGRKYTIQPAGEHMTCLAGIYRFEEYRGLKYPVFAVLTREAVGTLAGIHDRMPLILPSSAIDEWTKPDNKPEAIVGRALTECIQLLY